MPDVDPPRRTIRSFVLREGRLTRGQQRAFDQLWPRFGAPFEAPINLGRLFGNGRPVFLEIGFGDGEALARMATDNPGNNYLGIEMHRPGIGHLLLRAEQLALTNLRVVRRDAVEVVRDGLPDASLAGIYLFFPDPWHKRRHHKRRILQPGFVAEIARVLEPGGLFHAATDWEDYARHMLRVMTAADEFDNCAADDRYADRPGCRPLTRFEQRGLRLGHGVRDLIFRRCGL